MLEAPPRPELEGREVVRRLVRHFRIFAETCLLVEDKQTQQPVPFRLKPVQRRLAALIIWLLYLGMPVRIIVLKARREGVSTVVQAIFFWLTCTRTHQKCVTIAQDDETTKYLHGMSETFFDKMPPPFRPQRKTSKAGTVLEFANPSKNPDVVRKNPGLEGSLRTVSWKNAAAGQGATKLHLSEVGLYPRDQAKKTLDTALQTVPLASNTIVVLESTARGVGNEFYRRWRLAEQGVSEYIAFFVPWCDEPTNRIAPPVDFRRTPEEEALADEHGLDDAQLFWRRHTIANECGGDIDTFHQEYPLTPEEAFLATGRPYFNRGVVKSHWDRAMKSPPMMRGNLVEIEFEGEAWTEFRADERGFVRIWERPDMEEDYVIFCDSSEGRERSDFQCVYVASRSKLKIVASWHGRIDRDALGDEIFKLGKLYGGHSGEALVAIELTGGWGLTPQAILKRRGYSRIFQRFVYDQRSRKRRPQQGWKTTPETRALMLDALNQALRTDALECSDIELLNECFTFIYDDVGKPVAEEGAYDDRVITAAGLVYLWQTEPIKHKQEPSEPRKVRSVRTGY